jgi:hypothetical protein
MRTTITMHEETHAFASYYAQSRGITLSAAIEELIRKAQAPPQAPPEICYSPSGLPMFSPSGGIVTPALVKNLEEEEFAPKAFA